ncbi:MAG: HAD family hydrolase [Parachlamydiaceae bacterium]
MVKAVLIDLDGTLVDSTPALYQVYLKFLEHYGHQGNEAEFQKLIGPSIDEIVANLKNKYKLEEDLEKLANMYVSFIILQGFEGTKLFDGVKEFIDYAKEHGIKLAIVTSGTQALAKICLEPFNLLEKFDAVITSEEVKNAKPHPEIYETAIKKLQVNPEEVIAVEDSELGAESARQAGLKVLVLTHGKPVQLDHYPLFESWKDILKQMKDQP